MSKQTEKNTTCTDRDTKKNVYYIFNNFDYLQLHFCVQNLLTDIFHFFQSSYIVCSKKFYQFIHRCSFIVIT